jgi:hypothetical protein
MKRVILISALLVLMFVGSAAALEYHMPVNIQTTITPSVLMPGDEALLMIELQNGAAAYGVGGTAGEGTYAQSSLLSTPINKTTLTGTDEIQVLTPDQTDIGMIGPNDKIVLYYKIKAGENISNGTYLVDFNVQGGYNMLNICREIPIKVDAAPVSLSIADSSAKSSISLNVANPREGTLNAVTIVPSAKGMKFSPEEYYIGTMDSDEVFTISFDISQDHAEPGSSGFGGQSRSPNSVNMSFVSKFKNGDTWHISTPYVTAYVAPIDTTNSGNNLPLIGGAGLIVVAVGAYLYRRRKIQNGKNQNGKSGLT